MQQLGFRSVFAKLFASVMLALILFASAMVALTQLVHDKDAGIRSEVLATQILGQIDPFLQELNTAINKENRLQARFMLAVVKKSFDIFDESLQAKMGLYDQKGHLLMQTDNSDLPLELPATPSILARIFPSFSDTQLPPQAQVMSNTGYTLLYESRLPPKKPVLSAALNLFTGTLLLLIIMAGVLWWIARSITWQINQMSRQMVQLGDGDFSVRVNARGNDEIATLARGFNQAAQKIEHLINANSLLLAHASHELRTPITRIRLQVEMMDMLASTLPEATKAKFDKRAGAINRDLSGLNDLVESILLVSRLDAGHAVQQVERLDIYDLVNQERQHYPEATLIGEHLTIDGQPPLLTHLIRNLLNNALLHGVPPVTVLIYGVQDIASAEIVPEYLLQAVVANSFLVDDNDDFQWAATLEEAAAEEVFADPIVYCNGDSLGLDDDAVPSLNLPVLTPQSGNTQNTVAINIGHPETLRNRAFFPSDDLGALFKRAIWRQPSPRFDSNVNANLSAPANTRAVSELQSQDVKTTLTNKKGSLQKDNAQNGNVEKEKVESPKESLFKKHLRKVKADPVRPAPKFAVIAVIDEGSGIPEDKREEIFSPFVRLQQKKKGSGLGLSLVSQIVSAHQGRIKTDTLNGHTRFLVVLPVRHDPHFRHEDNG